jgi:uncharacterized membrane protein
MKDPMEEIAIRVKAPSMMRHTRRHVEHYMGCPNDWNRDIAYAAVAELEKQLQRVPVKAVQEELDLLLFQLKKWDAREPEGFEVAA